jgi:hypothetical protein
MDKRQYLLVCLLEELAEMQQEVCKCLRFTCDDQHPARPGTNLEQLIREFSDMEAILQMLGGQGINIYHNHHRIVEKKTALAKWMKRSEDLGALNVSNH